VDVVSAESALAAEQGYMEVVNLFRFGLKGFNAKTRRES
jgi:hypothetical protein